MTATAVYVDPRRAKTSRPFAVTLRHGDLVEIRHFATAKDAMAFYKEHKA
jgi:hypothetical protein